MLTKQIWKIGDCLSLMHDLPDKSIDLILTDPPYGVNYSKWDSLLPLEWFYLSMVKAKTVAFTPGLMNMYRYPEPDCIIAIVRPGSIQHQKKGGGFSHWEPVLVYGEHLPNVDMVIVRAQTDDPNNGHPCPKSLEMYSWLVSKLSHEGETILEEKKLVQAVLEGEQIKAFDCLKGKLNMKNDSEVLRWAITYTNKRTK